MKPDRTSAYVRLLLVAVSVEVLALAYHDGVRKGFDVRLNQGASWGRYQHSISAAISKSRFGVGEFVSYIPVEAALTNAGFTDNESILERLGSRFPDNLQDPRLLQRAINAARKADVPPPRRDPNARGFYVGLRGASGEDLGTTTYTRIAFALFGRKISSLYRLYFLILLVSLGVAAAANRGNTAFLATLMFAFSSLYILVSSSLFGPKGLYVNDPRFFSTLIIIPLMHILFFCFEKKAKFALGAHLPIAVQTAAIAFVVHCRSSALWSLIAVALIAILTLPLPTRRSIFFLKALAASRPVIALVTLGGSILIMQLIVGTVAHPLYRSGQDIWGHTVWQSILSGLQVNPEWATRFGPSVNNVDGDAMPMEITKIYLASLPIEKRAALLDADGEITRATVEHVSKLAVLQIAREHPDFLLATFFHYRMADLYRSSWTFFFSLPKGPARPAVVLSVILAIIAGVVLARLNPLDIAAISGVFWSLLLSSFVCLIPNWLIAANKLVMADHYYLVLVLANMVVATVFYHGALSVARQKTA